MENRSGHSPAKNVPHGIIWLVVSVAFIVACKALSISPGSSAPLASSTQAESPHSAVGSGSPTSVDFPSTVVDNIAHSAITGNDYLQEGEYGTIADGINVSIFAGFKDKDSVYYCSPPHPGFGVSLGIQDMTDNDFFLRYDPAGFRAEDDLGNRYLLHGSTIEPWPPDPSVTPSPELCVDPPGFRSYRLVAWRTESITVTFRGNISPNAKYLIITADSLSDVRVVFHKKVDPAYQ